MAHFDRRIHELFKLLKVNVTYKSIEHKLRQHPTFPSLFSLSDSIDRFGIPNKAVRISSEQLNLLETPFLATTIYNETLLVKAVEHNELHFFSPTLKWESSTMQDFLEYWNKMVVLVDTKKEGVAEENFSKRRKSESLEKLKRPIIFTVLLFFIGIVLFNVWHTFALPFLISKIVGLAVMLLLVNKEIDKDAEYQFCKVGKKMDCDGVLNSPAAIIFPGISMTDIGLLYFSGTLLVSAMASLVSAEIATTWFELLFFLSFLSIPYTLFSLSYQAFVVKKWCMLCLATIAVLWVETTIGYLYLNVNNYFQDLSLEASVVFVFMLLLPLSVWMYLKNILIKANDYEPLHYSYLRIINDPIVFEHLQQRQKPVEMDFQVNEIVLGDIDAENLLVIAVNPYCPACGREYKTVLKLLRTNPKSAKVIIRFAGSLYKNDQQKIYTSSMLINHYLNDATTFAELLEEWFDKRNLTAFVDEHPIKHNKGSEQILKHHYEWSEKAAISITPTTFLNNRKLSEEYTLNRLIEIL